VVIYDAEDVPDPLQLKNAALRNPAASGDWIIKQPGIAGSLDDPPDLIAQQIKLRNPAFLSQFTLIVQESSGIRLYYRQAAGSLQTRTLTRISRGVSVAQ
jgi:hypothetical protein